MFPDQSEIVSLTPKLSYDGCFTGVSCGERNIHDSRYTEDDTKDTFERFPL